MRIWKTRGGNISVEHLTSHYLCNSYTAGERIERPTAWVWYSCILSATLAHLHTVHSGRTSSLYIFIFFYLLLFSKTPPIPFSRKLHAAKQEFGQLFHGDAVICRSISLISLWFNFTHCFSSCVVQFNYSTLIVMVPLTTLLAEYVLLGLTSESRMQRTIFFCCLYSLLYVKYIVPGTL